MQAGVEKLLTINKNGTGIVKQLNAEAYRNVEVIMDREALDAVIAQLPGMDWRSFDAALNRSIACDECMVDDDGERVVIPVWG